MRPWLAHNRDHWTDSYVIIDEVEVVVRVRFKWVKAEPDVNEPGGLDLYDVYADGVDVMDKMTDDDLDDLALRVGENYEEPGEE